MNREKYSTVHTFLRLLVTFGHKHLLICAVLFTALLAAMDIIISYSVKRLLDSAILKDFESFTLNIVLLTGAACVQVISRYFRTILAGKYTEKGLLKVRSAVTDHLLNLPIAELEKTHSGDFISRMTNDMNKIREFMNQSLLTVIYQPLAALGAFIYLLTLNWQLTIIVVVAVPVIYNLSSKLSAPIAKYTKETQEKLALVNRETQDAIGGIEIIKSYSLIPVVGQKFNKVVDESVVAGNKVNFTKSLLQAISLFTSIAPFFICFGFGGYWIIKGQMTAGSLLAFITLLNPLTYPISQLPSLFGELKSQMVAANRVLEILDLKTERKTGSDISIDTTKPAIAFKNVTFAYPDGEQILTGVSFEVKVGENIALVGPSGSGKTTIFNLILGYFENYEGEIELFGHSIREWNLYKLRGKISLIAQDTYLFPGTISENISFGKGDVCTDEIVSAAKAAYAHDFIAELKDGYQTDVGEFGDKLSGGQKQRISIARAILKNAPLFLLDEATSSLDTQAESQIQKALGNMMQEGVTSILISHRHSTVQMAERIIVINNGRIEAEGTHDELIHNDSLYQTMFLRQMTQDLLEGKEGAM